MFRRKAPDPLDKLPFLERKRIYFDDLELKVNNGGELKKLWYLQNYPWLKKKYHDYYFMLHRYKRIAWLISLNLPVHFSFLRWVIVDQLRGKGKRFWGIYQFVGLPGEGKTISMVAHIERALANNYELVVATNFHYKGETASIGHWLDIIKVATKAKANHVPCIIAIDEIQNTFDASEWKSFPRSLYALLSFNRKLNLQFLCSAQIYERIPSKIRMLANYTVICKNVWKADRYFMNYYFEKNNYESTFAGKKAKASFIREFIADDELYSKYDTLEQIKTISGTANEEKKKKEEAFQILFGGGDPEEDEEPKAKTG